MWGAADVRDLGVGVLTSEIVPYLWFLVGSFRMCKSQRKDFEKSLFPLFILFLPKIISISREFVSYYWPRLYNIYICRRSPEFFVSVAYFVLL